MLMNTAAVYFFYTLYHFGMFAINRNFDTVRYMS